MRSLSRPLLGLELLVLVGVALWALLFQLRLPTALPEDSDVSRAVEALLADAQPGDAVLLHPWWLEGARRFVPTSLPVIGYPGADAHAHPEHPRLWLLSAPSLPRTPASPLSSKPPLSPPRRFGNVELTLYKNPAFRRPLFSAFEALGEARVWVEEDNKPAAPCLPMGPRGSFRCPLGAEVHARWHEVAFAPASCVFVQPPSGQARVILSFDSIPRGHASLRTGLIWDRGAFREPHLTPTDVRLESDAGQALAHVALAPGQEGFLSSELEWGLSSARLSIQAKNPALRETCVQFHVYDTPKGAP